MISLFKLCGRKVQVTFRSFGKLELDIAWRVERVITALVDDALFMHNCKVLIVHVQFTATAIDTRETPS